MQKAIRLLCWLIVILVIGACFIYYVEGTDNQSKTSLFLLAVAVNLYCTFTWEWILAVFRLISIDDDETQCKLEEEIRSLQAENALLRKGK